MKRHALKGGRGPLALRDCDKEVAAPRHRDADGGMPRAVGHLEIVGPQPARHVGNPDHPARLAWNKALADQIEIGDAIDFAVIGDAAVAIAKAELRTHIHFNFVTAQLTPAMERAAGGP